MQQQNSFSSAHLYLKFTKPHGKNEKTYSKFDCRAGTFRRSNVNTVTTPKAPAANHSGTADNVEAAWNVGSGAWHCWEQLGRGKEGIREFLEEASWSVKHVFREQNSMADTMAKKAKDERWSWNELYAIPRVLRDSWYMAQTGGSSVSPVVMTDLPSSGSIFAFCRCGGCIAFQCSALCGMCLPVLSC